MTAPPDETLTEQRKGHHIDICLDEPVGNSANLWDGVHLMHQALPEVDLDDIDTSCKLFGRPLSAPLIISAMTGGIDRATRINDNLAAAAAECGIGMGVGSQRAALEKPSLAETYSVVAGYEVPLRLGNLGAPQLIRQGDQEPYSVEQAKAALEMIDGHVLALHINYLQEVVQPEGDHQAEGALEAMTRLARKVPVVAKETGAGLNHDMALALADTPIVGIDVGGAGGTSFSKVEYYRARDRDEPLRARLGVTFGNWGIPTPASVVMAQATGLPIIATGGLNTGLDVARAIVLGANAGGMARAFLKAATESKEAVVNEINIIIEELKAAMFLVGVTNLSELADEPYLVLGDLKPWMDLARDQVVG